MIGLAVIQRIGSSGDVNRGLLYFFGGLIVCGVGTVIIYHDIAKDKTGIAQNDIELLAKAYKQKDRVDKKFPVDE